MIMICLKSITADCYKTYCPHYDVHYVINSCKNSDYNNEHARCITGCPSCVPAYFFDEEEFEI